MPENGGFLTPRCSAVNGETHQKMKNPPIKPQDIIILILLEKHERHSPIKFWYLFKQSRAASAIAIWKIVHGWIMAIYLYGDGIPDVHILVGLLGIVSLFGILI